MPFPGADSLTASQFMSNPQNLAMTASSVKSTQLTAGLYYLYSSTAINWLQGPTGVVATANSIPLPAVTLFGPIFVTGATDGFIAAIAASGTVSIIAVT